MKLSISIQANNTKTTTIIIPDEDTIIVNGDTTDLSLIPNEGTADGVSPLLGQVIKDASGEHTLAVLCKYVPSNTKWNGQQLEEKQFTHFVQTDGTGEQLLYSDGSPILDDQGQPTYDGTGDDLLFDVYDENGQVIGQETKPLELGIMDFVVVVLPDPPITEPTP